MTPHELAFIFCFTVKNAVNLFIAMNFLKIYDYDSSKWNELQQKTRKTKENSDPEKS